MGGKGRAELEKRIVHPKYEYPWLVALTVAFYYDVAARIRT